jgi:hypothetical protein
MYVLQKLGSISIEKIFLKPALSKPNENQPAPLNKSIYVNLFIIFLNHYYFL